MKTKLYRCIRKWALGLGFLFAVGCSLLAPLAVGGPVSVAALRSGNELDAPVPGDSAWSILRRLEALSEEEFAVTVGAWEQALGEPLREALILLAGSQDGPGWTLGVQERRERFRSLALDAMAQGLQAEPELWNVCLAKGLDQAPEAHLERRLASMRCAARLDRYEWADAIAQNLNSEPAPASEMAAREETLAPKATHTANGAATPSWQSRVLHREAQSALYQLYGVRFASREEYQAFPHLLGEAQLRYRDAFTKTSEREFLLRKQLLDKDPSTASALLRSNDARLRELAVQRMIEAVGNQLLPAGQVRQEFMARLSVESHPRVLHRLLQGTFDLALAAGATSDLVAELRQTLEGMANQVPAPLAPTLLGAIERLPRLEEPQGVQDWKTATGLLLALFQPELRLDSDTTAQVLRSWSRIHSQVVGLALDWELKTRSEECVLDRMVDPLEPERVRLAAAEALASANIGSDVARRIALVLQSPDSSTHLRLVCYPLIIEVEKRMSWNALQGASLIDAILRDLQGPDVDLRQMAIGLARTPGMLDRLIVVEREQGSVLPPCMRALEDSPSAEARRSLLPLIRELSLSSPRPDLLASHLCNPAVGTWVEQDPSLAKELAPIYLALAGPGQASLIYDAAQSWLRAAPNQSAVGTQSLTLVMALPVADARALGADKQVTLCEQAQAQLVRLPRSDSALWASRLAQRFLEVHLSLARSAERGERFDHLEALLLAQQTSESQEPALAAFDRALRAHPGNSRERFLILRDRGRFLEPLPPQGDATSPTNQAPTADGDWLELVNLLTQVDSTQGELYRADLDFTDLSRAAQVAGKAGLALDAASLWQARTASPLWRGLPTETCLRDLIRWVDAVFASQEPALAASWLAFQAQTIERTVPSDDGGSPQTIGWLHLEPAAQKQLDARRVELQRALLEWQQASTPSDSEPLEPAGNSALEPQGQSPLGPKVAEPGVSSGSKDTRR